MDPLSAILASVRLGSTAISAAQFSAPWSVHTRGAPSGIFHAILEGNAWIVPGGEATPTHLLTGDVVVLPTGMEHTLCDHPGTAPVPIRTLRTTESASGVPSLAHGGKGASTRIFCGTFHLHHDAERSFLALLPSFMHVTSGRDESRGEPVSATLRILDHEARRGGPGAKSMILRLCDVLFVQVLREHMSSEHAESRGWLAALRDEHVGRALALIHQEPGVLRDIRDLASAAGTSRSRLFARFTELVGEPPARYAARWRALTAADLLGQRNVSVADVAEQVGYSSEDAFVKAFKRHFGQSPSEYRRRRSAPLDA